MAVYRCPDCDGFFDDDIDIGTDIGADDMVCPSCYEDKYYAGEGD